MKQPNILLLMTDQQRGDALGFWPDSCVETPYLDQLASEGVWFRRAFSACPVCIPARRTLMSGKTAVHHKVLMNFHAPLEGLTIPQMLRDRGYQTHLCGKLHLYPQRKLYGFCSADWADGPYSSRPDNDYDRFLMRRGHFHEAGLGHGMSYNGWASRPFHMDESLHFTNWCTECALEFLERRDPTVPFFLNVSYHQPHGPCTPPAYYFQKYLNRQLPAPVMGDWEKELPNTQRGRPVNAWRGPLPLQQLDQYRAGYYGCVEQIDHQIGRLLYHLPENTVVVFCSDHGDMLGDHGWFRKRGPYQGSVHIPLMLWMPESMRRSWGIRGGTCVDTAVELMDIFPTLADLAGGEKPADLDGESVLPLCRGEQLERPYLHGECARLETIGSGMQFLTDGSWKYIWYPALGKEQLFHLPSDPGERHNLAGQEQYRAETNLWRAHLIRELEGRPEGFVREGCLVTLEGATSLTLDQCWQLTGKEMS